MEFFRAVQKQHSPLSRESAFLSLRVLLRWLHGLRVVLGLLWQPVTHGRQLCREGACSSTKSVPVQIVRPWQAAGAGSTAGRHMQGMLAVPRGTSLLPLLRAAWRFPGRDDAMKMSSLPVVLRGPAVVPTAGTKYCHCFFFPFSFFHPLHHGFHSRMTATGEGGEVWVSWQN